MILNSGVFVPDSLLPCRLVSNGAKLLWARLARYAGTKGLCFPLLSTLAVDLGFPERQVQRYLAELVSGAFLRARQRGFNKSNVYEFLWHPALAASGAAAPVRPEHLKTVDVFRTDARYGGDGTRIDLAYAVYTLSHGATTVAVEAAIRSRDLTHKGNERRQNDYVARTIKKALATTERGR